METLIRAEDISKYYGRFCALDRISLDIPRQSIFGLLGPNGAGKTTFIRIVNQIIAHDQGQLFFGDEPLKPHHVDQIGYLPEERGLYKKMQVGEQALYLAQLKGLRESAARRDLKNWFEKFDLMPWWNKKTEELSKGMQQKVQFIITLLHRPRLLIFDEPFSGFDPINVNLLKQEILRLKEEGATIIFSTHNMGSVEELCDHIVLINKARKILGGSVHEIKQQYTGQLFQARLDRVGDASFIEPDRRFELLHTEQSNGQWQMRIRIKDPGSGPNDLLKLLMGAGEVLSFSERIPSMNDIFIKHVTGSFPGEDPELTV